MREGPELLAVGSGDAVRPVDPAWSGIEAVDVLSTEATADAVPVGRVRLHRPISAVHLQQRHTDRHPEVLGLLAGRHASDDHVGVVQVEEHAVGLRADQAGRPRSVMTSPS